MDPYKSSAQAAGQAAGQAAYPRLRYSPPPGPPVPQYSSSPAQSPVQYSTEMSLSQSPQSTDSQIPFNQQNQQANWNQGRPAPWQLGNHTQYGFYNGQLPDATNEASEPVQTAYGWSKDRDDSGHSVDHIRVVNYAGQPEPEDVELTLHRGLQAHQVGTHRLPQAQY